MAESYGKRPLWQWILLYVLIGGLVYGLIYYFLMSKNGGGYNVGNSYESLEVAPEVPEPTPESGT